jgi:hypothetical protein
VTVSTTYGGVAVSWGRGHAVGGVCVCVCVCDVLGGGGGRGGGGDGVMRRQKKGWVGVMGGGWFVFYLV